MYNCGRCAKRHTSNAPSAPDAQPDASRAGRRCARCPARRLRQRRGIREPVQLRRRILARRDDGPQHRAQRARRRRCRTNSARCPGIARFAAVPTLLTPACAKIHGSMLGDDRADADEEALHRIAGGALRWRQLIADEGAERLHRDVDAGVEDPQHARRHPQHRRMRHRDQRQRSEHGAGEEIRAGAGRASSRCDPR